jgi:hypothetical protein
MSDDILLDSDDHLVDIVLTHIIINNLAWMNIIVIIYTNINQSDSSVVSKLLHQFLPSRVELTIIEVDVRIKVFH